MKTPKEIQRELSERERRLRKKQKMTLQQLADASGVSLGSVKRFESSGEISLQSMIKIASALGCEDDFSAIFAKNIPMSIEEIINGEI